MYCFICKKKTEYEIRISDLSADVCSSDLMLLSVLTLIPLAALLAYICSVVVTRPLRDLYRTISELGHGRYSHPVSITFPSEMRRLGEQLEWLRRRLAQLEDDKDQLMWEVSHELKTPLASLREGAELDRKGTRRNSSRQCVPRMTSSARNRNNN